MTNRKTHFLGQHMLIDQETIDYEIAMARTKGKVVLEIGGGTGNLTEAIAKEAKQIITIEKDPEMVEELEERFSDKTKDKKLKKKVKIVQADFLDIPADTYKADIIVGNIPYSASSPILFRLREWKFDHALLCVQKEFAERMVAKPGERDYSRLSIMSQIYFKTSYLRTVSKTCFSQMPAVDSAILILFPTKEKIDKKRDDLITKLFVHRKKTLAAALKSREFEGIREKLESSGKKLDILNKRIFHLSQEEIMQLLKSSG